MRFGLLHDLRNPASSGRTYEQHYQEVLDQIGRLTGWGFESVWITEHHCTDDGYTPSPLVVIAAMAQRAPELRFGTSVLLAPLTHPLRVAEDAATLAVLTEGRFDLGLGGGYSAQEFGAFGVNMRNRPSLMTETVQVLRQAFTGEPFSFEGKRFRLRNAQVTPVAQQPPRILMGAASAPAGDRAVRLADGFLGGSPANLEVYTEALLRAGRPRTDGVLASTLVYWLVAEDPDREWDRVGDHALYQMNTYVKWGAFPRAFADRDELRAAGVWQTLTADQAVDEIVALAERFPQLEGLQFFPSLPGEPIESANARLRYIGEAVLPRARERLAERSTTVRMVDQDCEPTRSAARHTEGQ